MSRMTQKLAAFMQGRYGMDQLGKTLNYGIAIVLLVSFGFNSGILYILGLVGLVYSNFRIFSKNLQKRHDENQRFLNFRYRMIYKKEQLLKRYRDRKTNKIFKCPNCEQKIRVPKGKGKICIKCPKCRIEFLKNT